MSDNLWDAAGYLDDKIAKLRAENADLKAEVDGGQAERMSDVKRYWMDDQNDADFPYECTDGDWVKYEDYARLQAEVERLRKAGDALIFCMNLNSASSGNAFRSWENAKEGKPSV